MITKLGLVNATMMNVILIEEHYSLKRLIEDNHSEVRVVSTCKNINQFLRELQKHRIIDALFLDIDFGHTDALQFVEEFYNVSIDIIVVSSYEQDALPSFKAGAIDYLLKPVTIEQLSNAFNKIKKRKSLVPPPMLADHPVNIGVKGAYHITLPTTDGFALINISNILRCEASGSYTIFYAKDGSKYIVSKNLKEYETVLFAYGFFRVHHSHIINVKEIKKYIRGDGGQIILSDNFVVDVSKRKKEAFLAEIFCKHSIF